MSLKRYALASTLYGAAEVAARIMQVVAMLWFARTVSKETYGELALYISIQQVITLLGIAGMVEVTSGHLNRFRADGALGNLFRNMFTLMNINLLVICVCYLLAYEFMKGFIGHIPLILNLCIILFGVLTARLTMSSTVLQLLENHRHAVLVKFLAAVGTYGFAMMGAYLFSTQRIYGFFLGGAAGLVLAYCVKALVVTEYEKDGGGADKKLMKSILADSIPFIVVAVFGWLSGQGNNFLIKYFFTNGEIAEYAMAMNFGFALLLVQNSVSNVWVPYFYRIAASRDVRDVNELNGLVAQGQLLGVSITSGVILLLFNDVLLLAGGNFIHYLNIRFYLFIVLSGYVLLTVYYRCTHYYLLHGHGRQFRDLILYSGILGTVLWIALMWGLGPVGIYIGFLVTMVLRAGAVFRYARDKWGVHLALSDVPLGLVIPLSGFVLGGGAYPLYWRLLFFTAVCALTAAMFYFLNNEVIKRHLHGRVA